MSVFYTITPCLHDNNNFVFIWQKCGSLEMDFTLGPWRGKIISIQKFGLIVLYHNNNQTRSAVTMFWSALRIFAEEKNYITRLV